MPEVRTGLRAGLLSIAVLDKRRIPGLLSVRVTRRGEEIYAIRTRVGKRVFRKALRVSPRRSAAKKAKKRDVICVAATYGTGLAKCTSKSEGESIARVYPNRAQLRLARRSTRT
jgi:hypothetical protein